MVHNSIMSPYKNTILCCLCLVGLTLLSQCKSKEEPSPDVTCHIGDFDLFSTKKDVNDHPIYGEQDIDMKFPRKFWLWQSFCYGKRPKVRMGSPVTKKHIVGIAVAGCSKTRISGLQLGSKSFPSTPSPKPPTSRICKNPPSGPIWMIQSLKARQANMI